MKAWKEGRAIFRATIECRNCKIMFTLKNPNQKNCEVCIDTFGKDRIRWLWKKYELTTFQYELLKESQRHRCGICKQALTQDKGRELYGCIDHDHKTGRIRGILCRKCNRALGQLGDNEEAIHRASNYLKGIYA